MPEEEAKKGPSCPHCGCPLDEHYKNAQCQHVFFKLNEPIREEIGECLIHPEVYKKLAEKDALAADTGAPPSPQNNELDISEWKTYISEGKAYKQKGLDKPIFLGEWKIYP